MSTAVEALTRLGGVATRRDLIAVTCRLDVDRALDAGDVVVLARGRYALPAADDARKAAHRLTGAVSWRSAALVHGWEVKFAPDLPEVTVPANRRLTPAQRAGILIHRGDLHSSEIDDGVTTKARTLADCLRGLRFDEGLAVADSALRHGFSPKLMRGIAATARGPGAGQMRRIADHATPSAANAFESVLRGIATDVPGLNVRPQVAIYDPMFLGRPDLVDERLLMILEADSFEWHGNRSALRRDARRYDEFVVRGWLVLRFAWEDVMFDPEWVRSILVAAVAERSDRACLACRAA